MDEIFIKNTWHTLKVDIDILVGPVVLLTFWGLGIDTDIDWLVSIPQIYNGGPRVGDEVQRGSEGAGLETGQWQAGLRRWYLCLCDPPWRSRKLYLTLLSQGHMVHAARLKTTPANWCLLDYANHPSLWKRIQAMELKLESCSQTSQFAASH